MPRRACRSLVRTAASLGSAAVPAEQLPRLPAGNGPVIVWFKRDLRVADHPGLLAAAASGRGVVPVFCLDEELYADVALAAAGPKGKAMHVGGYGVVLPFDQHLHCAAVICHVHCYSQVVMPSAHHQQQESVGAQASASSLALYMALTDKQAH